MKTLVITPHTKNEPSRLKNGKAPIYIKLSANGTKTTFPASAYIDNNRFKATSKLSKGRLDADETQVRDYINGIIKDLNKIEADFLEAKTPYTAEMIKNRILERDSESVAKGKTLADAFTYFNEYFKDLISKGQKTSSTLNKYSCIEDHINSFIKAKFNQSEYLLENLNNQFQKDFHTYLVNLSDEDGKKMKQNTHIKYVQNFRKVVRIAVDEAGWLKEYPFNNYTMTKEEETPTSLTFDEVMLIQDFQCGDNLSYQKAKDFFLFGCYTGLAYCDLLTLSKNDINNNKGDLFIAKKREKTGVEAIVYLQPEALEILNKYDGQNTNNSELCFPYYSDNSVNTHISTIAKAVGITKHVHYYMARHSFACVSIDFGQSLEAIKAALGHTSIKQTEHYARTLAPQIISAQKQIQGIFTRKEPALKVA